MSRISQHEIQMAFWQPLPWSRRCRISLATFRLSTCKQQMFITGIVWKRRARSSMDVHACNSQNLQLTPSCVRENQMWIWMSSLQGSSTLVFLKVKWFLWSRGDTGCERGIDKSIWVTWTSLTLLLLIKINIVIGCFCGSFCWNWVLHVLFWACQITPFGRFL